ncbi:hypothetical protein [Aggregatilinea sp.]|uniref:hypothetical protein n=1 Tax=Aggregatilinea sp. TaxID=2806333 RepID=UPI002D1FA277|nr:hypothetical protein [Aggregatilinea sp.]
MPAVIYQCILNNSNSKVSDFKHRYQKHNGIYYGIISDYLIAPEDADMKAGYFSKLPVVVWGFALLVFVLSIVSLPTGGRDWREDIMPASARFWDAPWLEGCPIPPYALPGLWPIAKMPAAVGTAANNAIAVIVFALAARRLGGSSWAVLPALAGPFGWTMFRQGQLDWLPLLALLLANGWELPLLVTKPQVGLWVALPRWRASGYSLRWLLPGLGVLALSLIVWGFWPWAILHDYTRLFTAHHNISTWPYMIPVGLMLVWFSWRKQSDALALLAAPLLFPYYNINSMSVIALVSAAKWPLIAVPVLIGLDVQLVWAALFG